MSESEEISRSRKLSGDRLAAIEGEFGLLVSRPEDEALVLTVDRAGVALYPGFQFRKGAREVLPLVATAVRIGRLNDWTDSNLAQWFCSPNGYLDGERPVGNLGAPKLLLAAANADLATRW